MPRQLLVLLLTSFVGCAVTNGNEPGEAAGPDAAQPHADDQRRLRYADSAPVPTAASAEPRAAPFSGRWEELPGTRLDDHAPEPMPPGHVAIKGLMAEWSGAVYDTRRERLVVWGGGHAGYAGNEIYAFDVAARAWSRVWGPTPNAQIPEKGVHEIYDDGNPSSRHTYDNIVYDPVADALWSNDGSLWKTGAPTVATWRFHFSEQRWERLADGPRKNLFSQTAYDPVDRIIVKRENRGVYHYDPQKDRWRKTTDGIWSHWDMNGEIDPVARQLVMVGGGRFEVYDLKRRSVTAIEPTGDTAILDAKAPGLAFHPPSGRIVAWGGGQKLYALEIDKKRYHWTAIDPAPNSARVSPPTRAGTYGRFRYAPSIDAFVLVNSVTTNVFLFHVE